MWAVRVAFLKRDHSAEPWRRGVWWGEFRAAETVDTKLWGVREDQKGSGRFTGDVAGDRWEMDPYQGVGLCPQGNGVEAPM